MFFFKSSHFQKINKCKLFDDFVTPAAAPVWLQINKKITKAVMIILILSFSIFHPISSRALYTQFMQFCKDLIFSPGYPTDTIADAYTLYIHYRS